MQVTLLKLYDEYIIPVVIVVKKAANCVTLYLSYHGLFLASLQLVHSIYWFQTVNLTMGQYSIIPGAALVGPEARPAAAIVN